MFFPDCMTLSGLSKTTCFFLPGLQGLKPDLFLQIDIFQRNITA